MIGLGKLVFLLTFFAMLLQSAYFFAYESTELIAAPLMLLLGGLAGFALSRRMDDPDSEFQVNIFFWAYSLRIWMGIILYGWDLKDLFGDEDASGYLGGWAMAKNWYDNGFEGFANDLVRVFFERQNEGQALIWAIPTFLAGGESRMIVSVVNCFAGALLVIVVFRMARSIFDPATARTASILVAFWLSHILLSATTSKEMLVIFFEWLVLFLVIRSPNGLLLKDGIAAIPGFLAVFIMRFYAVYMLAAAAFFRFIVASRRNLVRNAVFGSMIIGALFLFLTAGGAIQRDFDRIDRLSNRIDTWREGMAQTTGSGVEIYSEYESAQVAIPVATVYFFFAPFPWEVFSGSPRNAFGAVENIFIISMLVIGFPAWRIFFKDKFVEVAPILVFCALYAGMHIWGLSNVGLAWRHKQTIMPLFFLLVAVAISHRRAGFELISGRDRKADGRLSIIKAG